MAQDNDELGFEERMILEDAEAAFNWIVQNGDEKFGICFHKTEPEGDSSWVVQDKNGTLYAHRQAMRLAYCFALKRLERIDEEPPFIEAHKNNIPDKMKEDFYLRKLWRRIGLQRERKSDITATSSSEATRGIQAINKSISHQAHELFKRQFRQIILFGPPGTGKTYSAKKVLESLFKVDEEELHRMQGEDWDIVQFHPSYNYEDFVRGIKVETSSNEITYKTVNCIFGKMCERANKDKSNDYALIIDEINRANVSAVLGELIYALEYRGKSIKTPYTIGDSAKLIIPENLYIIGTMNNADRTIGQIDYAVRRRFSFVPCPPDRSVIKEKVENPIIACSFFDDVKGIFKDHISQDFESDDVGIGHSYFLAEDDELAYRILYQVVPILREYVKDGVLLQSAVDIIEEIRKDAEDLLLHTPAGEETSVDEDGENKDSETSRKQYFYWRYGKDSERFGVGGVGRTAFSVIKDFIQHNSQMDVGAINDALGFRKSPFVYTEDNLPKLPKRYFHKDPILHQGKKLFVSNQWGATNQPASQWELFKSTMKSHGYSIGLCYLVNVGENDGDNPSRTWEDCHDYNFVSARGKGYPTAMGKLKKGDLLFVRIAESSDDNTGYIAYAEVVEEKTHIAEVRTENGLLADTDVDNGLTYRQKYTTAFDEEYPDYAVKVKWLGDKPRNEVIRGISTSVRSFPITKIKMKDIRKLREEFNIPGWDV